jgi:hypothetical protein
MESGYMYQASTTQKWESDLGQHCLHCRIYLQLRTKHDMGQITGSGLPSDAGDVLPGRGYMDGCTKYCMGHFGIGNTKPQAV